MAEMKNQKDNQEIGKSIRIAYNEIFVKASERNRLFQAIKEEWINVRKIGFYYP